MAVLVVAETDGANLPRGTLATITAALAISPEVDVLVLDERGDEASEAASGIVGVRSVIKAGGPGLAGNLAENLAPAVVEATKNYGYVLAPAGTWGKNLMPRVAAMLDVQQISDITEIVDEDTFIRPIYAGNALATVRSRDPVKVITVRGTAFAVAEAPGGSAAITDGPEVAAHDIARFVKRELSQSDRPELAAARIVISGGRGMGSGENFQLLDQLADKLGAAVGASRAAVDAGYVPNDFQVGQTGKVVAPELYIAVGISGAIQHLAGMKDSKVIVAINKDQEAPIFQVADYGLVGDLFKIVPEIADAL
ncbi:MAG: FAD-binding protein [Rhodospirillales bacterium]|nr:FAD-binding protein [Rhodospirillales bacterium]MDE0711135.1 FAD-binding protein [Rhodospirillales bacterium]